MARIFVRRASAYETDPVLRHRAARADLWSVTVESDRGTLARRMSTGFTRACSHAADLLREYPGSEVRLPSGMTNVRSRY